jgi:predicted nucleic acid-binding protein
LAAPTLIDAGPLVALIDRGEAGHSACVEALDRLRPPFATTWAVLTEAMYLAGRGGWHAQRVLWQLLTSLEVELAVPDSAGAARARALMEQYRDVPMSLADASLVALAEREGARRVFSLDGHFRVYRAAGRRAGFDVLPVPLS